MGLKNVFELLFFNASPLRHSCNFFATKIFELRPSISIQFKKNNALSSVAAISL